MAAPNESSWETIWLGDEDTTADEGWLPCQWDATYNELSVFEGKVTFGAIDKDSDDIVSSWIISDLSGGGQIDMMTGADQSRYRHGIVDAASPGTITLPQYVQDTAIPGTGTTYPAYYISDTVMGIRGTNVYPWNEDTDSWGSGVAVLEPSAKPTLFDNKVFIPNGTSGYTILSGTTPTVTQVAGVSTPALSTGTDSPNVTDFEVWDQKLWAITPTGAVAFSLTGADNTWDWSHSYNTAEARWIGFDDSRPPKKLFTYADNNGDPILTAATTRAVYRLDATLQRWEPTNIQFAPHPNFASAVAVWRPGEDLHIGVGLEKITYTSANVIVPDQGLSRNDGMPYSNLGTISDLEPETSRLFACVSGSEYGTTDVTFSAKFGTTGTGDTNFTTPGQIATDSSGNVYVADTANNRLKKHQSDGTYTTSVTSLTGITGVCVDSSDNIYVTYTGVGTRGYVNKYNSALVLQWSAQITGAGVPFGHITTNGTHLFAASGSPDDSVVKHLCSTGAFVATYGTSGVGDGQFSSPVGIATDDTYLYIVDQGNDRVQKLTTSGTFVTKWGTSGVGNGQFQTPTAIAVHPVTGNIFVGDSGRDTVQEFNNNGTYLKTHGSSGSGDGQFTAPSGIAFNAAGTKMYVSDSSANRVQIFDITESIREYPAVPSVHYWNGLGWFGAWELTDSPDEQLTWGCIQATSHPTDGYSYWFGCSDGKLRRIPLRRTFHNPRAGWQAGYDRFASTGYLLSSRFNALMAGFYKRAHRLVVYMDNASPTETVTVKYRVDVEDDNWVTLGEVTSTGRTILSFGDDADGFSWGKRFNWIQFQFDFARGSDEYQTPVLQAAVLNYTKLPQQARSFTFNIPYPKRQWLQKTGKEIETHLSNMLKASSLLKLVHRDTTYRGQLAAVAGTTPLGKNDAGGARVSFIEIREQD